MQEPQFDAWTRLLASADSRRSLTTSIAGGALATLLAGLAWRDTEAKKRKKNKHRPGKKNNKKNKKKKCDRGEKRCGKRCVRSTGCCTDADCQSTLGGGECVQIGGVRGCLCPEGEEPQASICGVRPTCKQFQTGCEVNTECCSSLCIPIGGSPFGKCAASTVGEPCEADVDCVPDATTTCIGFVCGLVDQ